MSDTKYFNFPVQILKGIFEDKQKVLDGLLYYALYAHSLKLDGDNYYNNNPEFSKFLASAKWYNVTGLDNAKFTTAKKLYNSIPANSPKTGLNKDIFWDFYQNEKSDFDIACLSAFLAIRSILGTKPYCLTTNAYLWARMSGNNKSMKEYSELSGRVRHYAKEYQTVKIKKALREGWGLVTYSRYTRGFFVSFTLDLKALITEAETRRKSIKEKQYRQIEKDTVKQVLQSLNITTKTF